MASSADCDFPAAQKKILMRKLDFISEVHRNYLLKTYDLAGISLRINRYLTMARKEMTMVQHGEQCAVVYNQLQRGFDKDLQSIFANKSDPNMPHYDTAMRPHGNNDTKPTALTKTTTVEPTTKHISLETYQKRKQESMNCATKTVDVTKKPEPLPKLLQESGLNVKEQFSDKFDKNNKFGPSQKVDLKNDQRSVEKTKETKVTRLHHKSGKSKAQIQMLNHVNKVSSLQEVCKKIDQNNKIRRSVDKARVIIVTSPHHQRKSSKNKKRKLKDASKASSLQKNCKKIDKKIDKTNKKRSLDKTKDTKTSQKHDATETVTQPLKENVFEITKEHDEIIDEIITPWFEEKNNLAYLQKICEEDVENNQEWPLESTKAIDGIITYLKSSETNIEKSWSSNANELDFLPWIHQTCREDDDSKATNKTKTYFETETPVIKEQRLTNASNFRLGAKPLLHGDNLNIDIYKGEISNARISHQTGGAIVTKSHGLPSFQVGMQRHNNVSSTFSTSKKRPNEISTTSNRSRMPTGLQSLQMFCKQTVPNRKKRALESTDMNEPLPKYIRRFGPCGIQNLIDNADKRYTTSQTSNAFKDALDNTVNMINIIPSPLRYSKKRSLEGSNEINTSLDVKKMKIDLTITSSRYLYQ